MFRTITSAALAVAAMLVMFASVARASTEIAISAAGPITATSEGHLNFNAAGRVAECNVTMRGTLRTGPIPIAGGTVGEMATYTASACNGEVEFERALTSPLWAIASRTALTGAGILPNNYRSWLFTVAAVKIRFETFFGVVRCLWAGTLALSATLTRVGPGEYSMSRAFVLEEGGGASVFRLVSGSEACPLEGFMEGSFNITRQTITFR